MKNHSLNKNSISDLIRNEEKRSVIILALAIIIYSITFSYLSIRGHMLYLTGADLAIFEQSFWSTLHGEFFYTSIGGGSQFGIHNSPVLFLVIPFYAVFQNTETLLVVQSVLLALGAFPLYLIGKKAHSAKIGLSFAFLYLIYSPLHGVNLIDFHEIAFFPLFAGLCIYLLIVERWNWFFSFALLILFIKEDCALIVIMIGIFGLIIHRASDKKIKLLLAGLILIASAWLIISFFIIIPAFHQPGQSVNLNHYVNIPGNLLNHNDARISYIIHLFLPVCFLPLLAPLYLIPAIPAFGETLLPDRFEYFSIFYHYSALLIPFIFVSAIYGFKRLLSLKNGYLSSKTNFILIFLLIVSIISLVISPMSILINETIINGKMTDQFRLNSFMLPKIPEDFSISTQWDLLPHLPHRNNLYEGYNKNTDLVIIDKSSAFIRDIQMSKEDLENYTNLYQNGNLIILGNRESPRVKQLQTHPLT